MCRSRGGSKRIDDYAGLSERMRAFWEGRNHVQGGDPAKLARVMVELAGRADAPLRFAAGSDAVAMIEYTRMENGHVILDRPVRPSENIRPIGVDVSQGDLTLRRGATLGAAELGLLMTLGFAQVSCYRRPTVAVLSTGDELVEPWEVAALFPEAFAELRKAADSSL